MLYPFQEGQRRHAYDSRYARNLHGLFVTVAAFRRMSVMLERIGVEIHQRRRVEVFWGAKVEDIVGGSSRGSQQGNNGKSETHSCSVVDVRVRWPQEVNRLMIMV
jgi:hypothetical protein